MSREALSVADPHADTLGDAAQRCPLAYSLSHYEPTGLFVPLGCLEPRTYRGEGLREAVWSQGCAPSITHEASTLAEDRGRAAGLQRMGAGGCPAAAPPPRGGGGRYHPKEPWRHRVSRTRRVAQKPPACNRQK